VWAAATSTQLFNLTIGSTGFDSTTRIWDIAQSFQLFRLSSFSATALPYRDTTTADNLLVMAYSTEESNSADAATFAVLSQIPASCIVPALKTSNSTLRIGRRQLYTTVQNWYSTTSSGTLLNEVIQGKVLIAPRSSASIGMTVEFSGIIEFSQPTVDLAGLGSWMSRNVVKSLALKGEADSDGGATTFKESGFTSTHDTRVNVIEENRCMGCEKGCGSVNTHKYSDFPVSAIRSTVDTSRKFTAEMH
jgi:hypothetical protein